MVPAFSCEVYPPSESVPTSVRELRPGDVQVLAALGDSLTAAFGAKASTIFTLFNDYRGVSFASAFAISASPFVLRDDDVSHHPEALSWP